MPRVVPGLLLLAASVLSLVNAQTFKFLDTAVSIQEGNTATLRVEKTGASTADISVVVLVSII